MEKEKRLRTENQTNSQMFHSTLRTLRQWKLARLILPKLKITKNNSVNISHIFLKFCELYEARRLFARQMKQTHLSDCFS